MHWMQSTRTAVHIDTYSEERKDHDLAIKRQSNFPNRIWSVTTSNGHYLLQGKKNISIKTWKTVSYRYVGT